MMGGTQKAAAWKLVMQKEEHICVCQPFIL